MTKILLNKSNVDLDYPICRPSLDLDFTQEELDSRITFSRGTVGTRVNRNRLIETVSANLPRFDYNSLTGECKGLLIEESRQNLVTYSDDYSNAIWTKLGVSVTTNATTAPDGTLTADLITENNVSRNHQLNYSTATLAANTYTLSAFVKQGVGNRNFRFGGFGLNTANENPIFNISTGEVYLPSTTTLFKRASITPYPNGWYRCTCTIEYTGSTGVPVFATSNSSTNFGDATYNTDTTTSIYMWGAQVEVGAFPTSYIPTTSSTVTRSTDNASMTGTNFSSWYNQSEGSIISNCNKPYAVPNNSYPIVLGISNGGGNQINVGYLTEGLFSLETFNNYLRIIGTYPGSSNLRTRISGVSYNQTTNTYSIFTNAKTSSTVTSNVDFGTDMNTLNIGNSISNNGPLVGTISRLTYYPRALKPNQLQLLTQ
jgi:hypothetical protein